MTPIRAFFAIDLPKDVQKTIADIILELQKYLRNDSIRWTKPANLHVTLQFLEKLAEEDMGAIVTGVNEMLADFAPFSLEISQLELFPTPTHPRIISMTLEPHEKLAELAAAIGKGIQLTNYPVETRPFRGHMTLCRLNQSRPPVFDNFILPKIKKFLVEEVILFQSKPNKDGSYYFPLARIPLMREKYE